MTTMSQGVSMALNPQPLTAAMYDYPEFISFPHSQARRRRERLILTLSLAGPLAITTTLIILCGIYL